MNARGWSSVTALATVALLAWPPPPACARGLGVEVWTDRGDDAVYQPGQRIEVQARASDDAYLLVYEIDAEGGVRLLYPYRGSTGYVEGRQTYRVPPERANVDLVVDGPVGQCYVVAIASRDAFRELPWYLRPYDMQAEQVGYEGARDDEEGITAEGRIVGDPFVAMERIRRRVLNDAQDPDGFGTSYATYYVHNEVRYPRYLCYDCHRPGRWAWWSGFDPYYADCSVIDLRVNWGWGWGPGYWFGTVPYYNFVVRQNCPPHYRPYFLDHACFSSWDGWRRWDSMWGKHLVRYKSDPPPGYVAPSKFKDLSARLQGRQAPPGFFRDPASRRDGGRVAGLVGRNLGPLPRQPAPREGGVVWRRPDSERGRPNVEPLPRERAPHDGGLVWRRPDSERGRPAVEPLPPRERTGDPQDAREPWRGANPRDRGALRPSRGDEGRPPERQRYQPRAPGGERTPRDERTPRYERPRDDHPRESRGSERSRESRPADPGRAPDSRGGSRTRG